MRHIEIADDVFVNVVDRPGLQVQSKNLDL